MGKVKLLVRTRLRSGTVSILEATTMGGIILGTGWVFFSEFDGMDAPTLVNNEGNRLDGGLYMLHSVSQHLAVSPDRVQ